MSPTDRHLSFLLRSLFFPLLPHSGQRWQVVPKQDHLVCFLGGSFLLGVTEARLTVPPNAADFSEADREDWTVGEGIIRACVDTYEGTKTYVGCFSCLSTTRRRRGR